MVPWVGLAVCPTSPTATSTSTTLSPFQGTWAWPILRLFFKALAVTVEARRLPKREVDKEVSFRQVPQGPMVWVFPSVMVEAVEERDRTEREATAVWERTTERTRPLRQRLWRIQGRAEVAADREVV